MLRDHALWTSKYRSNVPAVHAPHFRRMHRIDHRGHHSQIKKKIDHSGPQDRIWLPAHQQYQAEPQKVCLWRATRHALRIHSLPARHQGQPQESLGHHQNGADSRRQGRAEGDGLSSGTQPLHLADSGKSATTIPAPEES